MERVRADFRSFASCVAFWVVALAGVAALTAGTANADTTTTLDFESPAIPGTTTPAFGPVITNQYQSDGVVFDGSTPVTNPIGFDPYYLTASPAHLYRDEANAHSGTQVLEVNEQRDLCDGGCFVYYSQLIAQLSTPTDSLSLDAGAIPNVSPEAGTTVDLAGYDAHGNLVAFASATAGTPDDTPLHLSTTSPDISYFSVAVPDDGSAFTPILEIDDLSFVVPSSVGPPPPPQPLVVLGPESEHITVAPGGTVTSTIKLQRFNGANNEVDLTVGGLPSGVTATGTTVPAGSDTATVSFQAAPGTALASNIPITISATSAGVSSIASLSDSLSIPAPLTLNVGTGASAFAPSLSLGASPCGAESVVVQAALGPGLSSTVHLSEMVSGPAGFTTSLSPTTLTPSPHGFVVNQLPTAALTLNWSPTVSTGDATVTITATDADGDTVTATVTTSGHGPLNAQALWVTQGSQVDPASLPQLGIWAMPGAPAQYPLAPFGSGSTYTGVTLVAHKLTVVRLYADDPGVTTPVGVTALLYGRSSDGAALPGSPLHPAYGASDISPVIDAPSNDAVLDPELVSESNAETFVLPTSWTETGGPISLTGTVNSYQGICTATSNYTLNRVSFTTVDYNGSSIDQLGYGTKTLLIPLAMIVNPTDPNFVSNDTPAAPAAVFDETNAAAPLSTPPFDPGLPFVATIDMGAQAQYSNLSSAGMSDVENWAAQQFGLLFFLYHFVGVSSSDYGGVTNSAPGNFSFVDGALSGVHSRPLTAVAHEVFHQFGLVHASPACGGGANGQVGEPWPPDQQGDLNGIGLNTTTWPFQFVANGLNNETTAFDFMSYCAHIGNGDPNDWLAPVNWNQVISNFLSRNIADTAGDQGAGASRVPHTVTTTYAKRLLVIASVTKQGVQIAYVGPLNGTTVPATGAVTSFTLTAIGSRGQAVASVPMAATTGGHIDPAGGGPAQPYDELIGAVPAADATGIQIADNGTAVASISRAAELPNVRLLAPGRGATVGRRRLVTVRWVATNPAHRNLTVSIDYSANDGRSWRAVFVGPNVGSISLPRSYFAQARDARIRLVVSDGFDRVRKTSSPFRSLGSPPNVTITSQLARGFRLNGSAQLPLQGEAVDQFGRELTGAQLRWFDGGFPLGTGATLNGGPLPPGTNHITLIARDRSGRTASATISVDVAEVSLPFLTLSVPARLGRHAHALTLRAASIIGGTLSIGHRTLHLTHRLRRYTLAVSPGRTLLLHLTVTARGVSTPLALEVRGS